MSVPDGERLDLFLSSLRRVVPPAALVIGYLSLAPRYLGLNTALIVLIGVAAAIQGFLVYLFKRDMDDKFDNMNGEIETLRSDLNNGIDRVVDAISDIEGNDTRTDGGNRYSGSPMRDDDEVDIELEEPSGAGALSGLVAGGLLGAPFGPAGVIVGGVLGGLLGNAVEYQNLKDEQQEKLQKAAWQYIQQNEYPTPQLQDFQGVTEGEDENGEYWEFEFIDRNGISHYVRLYLEQKRFAIPS